MNVSRALLSVQDHQGVEALARFLVRDLGAELLATPPTASFLRDRGLTVKETSGLCSIGDAADPVVRAPSGEAIDLVVVELPPGKVRPSARASFDAVAAQMDVMGAMLIRSAVARLERTCVVVDPKDYRSIVQMFLYKGDLDLPFCRGMARRALSVLAAYEGAIMLELTSFNDEGIRQPLPEVMLPGYGRHVRLSGAGSNAHQEGWFYSATEPDRGTFATSLNYAPNEPIDMARVRDASLAMELLAEHTAPTVLLLARQRPLAAATAPTIEMAVGWLAQRIPSSLSSAVVALNLEASKPVFDLLAGARLAAIAAPSVDVIAAQVAARKQGTALIAMGGMTPADTRDLSITVIPGGLLVEPRDATCRNEVQAGDAGGRHPTEAERTAMAFAWSVAKYARSDAIVIARQDGELLRTVGIGAGEPSRRGAIERALTEAGGDAAGAVLASDGPILAAEDLDRIANAGIRAVAHPGGPEDTRTFPVRGADVQLAIVATNVSHIRY